MKRRSISLAATGAAWLLLLPSAAFTNCIGAFKPVVITGDSDKIGCAIVKLDFSCDTPIIYTVFDADRKYLEFQRNTIFRFQSISTKKLLRKTNLFSSEN